MLSLVTHISNKWCKKPFLFRVRNKKFAVTTMSEINKASELCNLLFRAPVFNSVELKLNMSNRTYFNQDWLAIHIGFLRIILWGTLIAKVNPYIFFHCLLTWKATLLPSTTIWELTTVKFRKKTSLKGRLSSIMLWGLCTINSNEKKMVYWFRWRRTSVGDAESSGSPIGISPSETK